ncbi:MAG TPA: DUF2723 domain-containing protein [Burkholderiales bacterium]|nr:DUF2723 domain-containing protein [Burkholderiales bacterium]
MQSPPQSFRAKRADWLQAGLVAVVLFALYAATSPRTVSLEDDGLFILSSYFLGIEHPPGYPLFTLIGHLFSKLPFGSVAYRVHLASALFGALSGSAAWLVARRLIPGRLPAYLAAFALGFSPVFWSQAIIAKGTYTLNTFFVLVLAYLGLRACPPAAPPDPGDRFILPTMAFLFGLGMSNHWPLMLLVAPAFAVLLWPRRVEFLKQLPLLLWMAVLGLLPYGWMVYRSLMPLPISFDGPLDTIPKFWFFVTRAGYRGVDHSLSANWLDHVKFIRFLGEQLLVQFAVLGTVVAGVGVAKLRGSFGDRIAAFLVVAFLGPSVVLLLLLNFDYDSVSAHVYHVYPLPAYAIMALWLGLGFAWLRDRFSLRAAPSVGIVGTLLALILFVGSRTNLLEHYDWAKRYAHAVLRTLPQNATVFVGTEFDMATIAYFHLIDHERPDITLYQWKGLVLGNRLFSPFTATEKEMQAKLHEFIDQQDGPIALTTMRSGAYGRRDRWLYNLIDKSTTDPKYVVVDIPPELRRFFEDSILHTHDKNAWIAAQQDDLRRLYAALLARDMQKPELLDARTKRDVAALADDFYGALGLAEGLIVNKNGYTAGDVYALLNRARSLIPADVRKSYLSRIFGIRAVLRLNAGDKTGAIEDFKNAVSVWSSPDNDAVEALEDLYHQAGDESALNALRQNMELRERRLREQ